MALCAVVLSLTCTTEAAPKASVSAGIEIDRPMALVDEPVRMRVTGLRPGEHVKVASRAVDDEGLAWSARAQFTADGNGAIDLARSRPAAGTFRQADGMGLFWSMRPHKGEADESWFFAGQSAGKGSYEVRIAVLSGNREIASRTTTRQWRANGVRHKQLTVAEDEMDGMLFLPRSGAPREAPVLLIGGSEGGRSFDSMAALLASRGHPALSICYFACEGRPEELNGIDLEYFVRAARLLQNQSSAAPDELAVLGASRGSEAAQLLAQYYPDLVRDAVLLAPGTRSVFTGAGASPDLVSWKRAGRPIRLDPIPLNRVRGTVLGVAGRDDKLWLSADAAESIAERTNASGARHQALIYDASGHGGGGVPYQPTGRWTYHPVLKRWMYLGGTAAGDARSRADSWPRILRLLDR